MSRKYSYKSLSDAFTLAASPVVASSILESIRGSLKDGLTVEITLSEGCEPLTFSKIDEFEVWVNRTFYGKTKEDSRMKKMG